MSKKDESIIGLRGSKLVGLVKSREFRSRLAEAARLTARTGHESGFCYYQEYSKPESTRNFWTPLVEGGPTSIDLQQSEAPWRNEAESGFDIDEHLPLLLVHLHPCPDRLDLSRPDLLNVLLGNPSFDYRPMFGVGTVSERLDGHLVLMQSTQTTRNYSADILEQVWSQYQSAADLWPSARFGEALQVPGFLAACMLEYSIPKNSKYARIQYIKSLNAFKKK